MNFSSKLTFGYRYAEHVSSTTNRKYSFTEFKEMQSDTGVDYDCKEIITLPNEELVFLRNYGMAIERAVEELSIIVRDNA